MPNKKPDTELSLISKLEAEQQELNRSLKILEEIKLPVYLKKIQALGSKSEALIIASEDGIKAATDLAVNLKALSEELDQRRKELKAPGKAWVDLIDDVFQPIIKQANGFVTALRDKASAYKQKLLEEREAKERAAREEAEKIRRAAEKAEREAQEKAEKLRREAEALKKKDAAKAEELRAKAAHLESVASMKSEHAQDQASKKIEEAQVTQPQTVSQSGKTATAKESWAFEITDRKLVPDEFKEINEKMIAAVGQADIKLFGEPKPIAGIRWFKKASVAFGG